MNLILWRHADAEDAAPGVSDDARRLTAKGVRQAKRIAAWLRKQLPEDAEVLVSPARRAQQTAQALPRRFKTSDEVGTPARSVTALARSTAGVQLPQQAIPEMTASTSWRSSMPGRSASTRCS